MTRTRPALGDWKDAFDSIDRRCPWPGPRPLTKVDRDLLKGREETVSSLVSVLRGHSVVFVDALSGVGKSSLIRAGLVPALIDGGVTVLVCDRWGSDNTASGRGGIEALTLAGIGIENLPKQIQKAYRKYVTNSDTSFSLGAQLYENFGDTTVLVLDQFEELVRYNEQTFREAVDWIVELTTTHLVRVLISLRTEEMYRMKPLMEAVNPYALYQFTLGAIQDRDVIEDIIRSGTYGTDGDGEGPNPIEEKAVEQLLGLWENFLEGNPSDANLALLYIQALLYALYWRAERTSHTAPGTITTELVGAMLNEVPDRRSDGSQIFHLGLAEAAEAKIDACIQAFRDVGYLDEYLVAGTKEIVRRIVPHLSSGGYKVPVEETDIAERVLEREANVLGSWLPAGLGRPVSAAFKALRKVAAAQDSDLLQVPNQSVLEQLVPDGRQPAGTDMDDPVGVSAGPMFGSSPLSILVEESRRVAFALEWLEEAKLVRRSSPTEGTTMVSLIHDGFGPALTEWARSQRPGFGTAVYQLTAARGENFVWGSSVAADGRSPRAPDLTPFRAPNMGDETGHGTLIIPNLRWRDCTISADFEKLVFVNCDFRGTRFANCRIRGVTFVNCLLDEATFEECDFVGPASPPDGSDESDRERVKLAPSFNIEVSKDLIRLFAPYLPQDGVAPGGDDYYLFSETSGVPAIPGRHQAVRTLEVNLPDGGFAMEGGRLCSLRLYRCSSGEQGNVAFHHVSGSGLEIIEHKPSSKPDDTDIRVYGSAVRGLSIARDEDDVGPDGIVDDLSDEVSGMLPLCVEIRSSLLVDTSFGDRLTGKATLDDCTVWLLLNANDGNRFKVRVQNCRYMGLLGTDPPDEDSIPDDWFDGEQILRRAEVAAALDRMDYRYRPERWARRQRTRYEDTDSS